MLNCLRPAVFMRVTFVKNMKLTISSVSLTFLALVCAQRPGRPCDLSTSLVLSPMLSGVDRLQKRCPKIRLIADINN